MSSVDESSGVGRVTRSLRKRLTSIDSDGSRPVTPVPIKLPNISENNDAAASTPARVTGRRSSVSTPVKTPRVVLTRATTPLQTESPARRTTRRTSIQSTDVDDVKRVDTKSPVENIVDGGKLKSSINHIKTAASGNSPMRRTTRSRSVSVSEDDHYTSITKIVKQPQFDTLDENEEDRDDAVVTSKVNSIKMEQSPLNKSIDNNTKSKEKVSRRSTRLNSDVEVIILDDTVESEGMAQNTPKSDTDLLPFDVSDEDDKILIREKKNSSQCKEMLNASVEKTKEDKIGNTSSNKKPKPFTPTKGNNSAEIVNVIKLETLSRSEIETLSNVGEKSRSVKFDNSINDSDMSKTMYPKTPITTKYKSITVDSGSRNKDDKSFESEKSFVSALSYKDVPNDLIADTARNTSKELIGVGSLHVSNDVDIDEKEDVDDNANDTIVLSEKTPHKLKTLHHEQSSTPIANNINNTSDKKKNTEKEDEQKLMDVSPDKYLRSGKVYGSSPTPPKSTAQHDSNISNKSKNSSNKGTELFVDDTSMKNSSKVSESNSTKKSAYNEIKELDAKAASTIGIKEKMSEFNSNVNSSSAGENVSSSTTKKSNTSQRKSNSFTSSWSPGVTVNANNNTGKIDEIKSVQTDSALNKKSTIIENSKNNTSKQRQLFENHRQTDSDSDNDDEHEDEDEVHNHNSFINDKVEDAGDDYHSGDSMDEEERREIEENAVDEAGESIGTEDTEEDDDDAGDDDDDGDDTNSFIASENEEDLLEYSDDDEHLEDGKSKVYKRVIRDNDDNDDGNGDDDDDNADAVDNDEGSGDGDDDDGDDDNGKTEEKLVKANDKKMKDKSHDKSNGLELELSKLIDFAFSDDEFQLLSSKNNGNHEESTNVAKSADSPLNTKRSNENSNKSLKVASDSSSLNQSTLSESAMKLQISPCNERTEDEAQLNASRKKILNELNKSEQFNRTFIEVESTDVNDESENSPEVKSIATAAPGSRQSACNGKSPARPRKEQASYASSSDEDESPVSASVIMQKQTLYQSSSDENDDVQQLNETVKKSRKSLSNMEPINVSQKRNNDSNSSLETENDETNLTIKKMSSTKTNKSLNNSNRNEAKKKLSQTHDTDSDGENDEDKVIDKISSGRNSLSNSQQNQSNLNASQKKKRDSGHDSEVEHEEEKSRATANTKSTEKSRKSLNSSQHNDSNLNASATSKSKRKSVNNVNNLMDVDMENNENSTVNTSKTKHSSNVLNKHDTETSDDEEQNEDGDGDDDDENPNYMESIMKHTRKNVSFADMSEERLTSKKQLLSQSFGVLEHKSSKDKHRQHHSFTIGVSVTNIQNNSKSSSNTDEEFISNDHNQIEYGENNKFTSGEMTFSSDDEQRLEKIAQIQKLNEINSDKKKRKSMLLPGDASNDKSVSKKKKQRKASLPYSGELNPSQSFVETITEHKLKLQEEHGKRKKRLSKSFSEATTLGGTYDTNEKENSDALHGIVETVTASRPSTSKPKLTNDGNNNIDHILKRCDEMLEAANYAKLQSKINDKEKLIKKEKKIKQKEKGKGKASKTNSSSENANNQSSHESIHTHSLVSNKEKTAEAVEQALKASTEILLKNTKKHKRQLKVEDNHSTKRLPSELLNAIAEQTDESAPPPVKKMKKGVQIEDDANGIRKTTIKSKAGNIKELPISPMPKKKKRTLLASTGVITEEPVTPKPASKLSAFHESPITPRIGFKVRQILTAGQDVPPELPNAQHKKGLKRKRKHIEEPKLRLPKPRWTQSGVFIEEKMPSTHTINQIGGTVFNMTTLTQGPARTHKVKKSKKKKSQSTPTTPSINASAFAFKHKSLVNNCKIIRESSRSIMRRKERVEANQRF